MPKETPLETVELLEDKHGERPHPPVTVRTGGLLFPGLVQLDVAHGGLALFVAHRVHARKYVCGVAVHVPVLLVSQFAVDLEVDLHTFGGILHPLPEKLHGVGLVEVDADPVVEGEGKVAELVGLLGEPKPEAIPVCGHALIGEVPTPYIPKVTKWV